ncbi:MAG: right-handed parallel beta-helix repeat-containing protein [Candidatus ainarchaeum sp.]|nr:right-handed parallel beta-helix repeat-containing protein [Candidatus ainarchaeum sp.]
MANVSGGLENISLEIVDESNATVYNETGTSHAKSLPPGNYKVNLKPKGKPVKEIAFSEVDLTSDTVLLMGLDEVAASKGFGKQYALMSDAGQAATVTVNATAGKALFVCASWNFETQACTQGAWKKVKGIYGTQEYNFTMGSGVFGYGEANDTVILTDSGSYMVDSNQTVLANNSGLLDVLVEPSSDIIGSMAVYGYNESSGQYSLGFEHPSSAVRMSLGFRGSSELYSVDAADLNFTNATVTATAATGQNLYKCANWNFTLQQCDDGNWTLFMSGIPAGQQYSFTIQPGDPGFAEIEIFKAEHLDESRAFLENIYPQVSARDFVYKEIPAGHYARVVFEENLSAANDIRIYAKSNYSDASVQVYEKDGTTLLADFGTITADGLYIILLTNLTGIQDTFDLGVSGNPVEFDYIVDPPTVNVTLNATSPYNLTTDNLTCNYDLGGANTSAVAWYKNGAPAMLLYLPMEGNSSNALLDYSGYGNNGTNANGSVWSATGGYNGNGTFTFNGVNQYLNYGNNSRYRFTGPFTITGWIKVNTFNTAWQALITKGDGSWRIHRYNAGNTLAFGTTGLSSVDVAGTKNVNDGQWHFFAAVYNGTYKILYIDGVLDAAAAVTGTLSQNTYDVLIGENQQQRGRYWNGSIDEIRIYNYSLSSNETWALYQNQTNLMVSQELTAGDIWQCRVTPFSTTEAGTTANSNNVTINSAVIVAWNQSTLSIGGVQNGTSRTSNATVTSYGSNNKTTVAPVAGNGTAFINATPLSLGNLSNYGTAQVQFNCSPPGSQALGYYEAVFRVNSTSNISGNNITVGCTVAGPPSIVNLTLNATSAYNSTADNLTCNYALNGSATTAAVAWYVNGTPEMALYMPFEGNSSNALLDYSGNGNNGTNAGAAVWSATGGYNGNGAFTFSATSTSYINLNSPSTLNFTGYQNFTIATWVRVDGGSGTHRPILCKGDQQYCLKPNTGNYHEFCVYDGAWKCAAADATLTLGQWYFVVGRTNGTEVALWVNGVKQAATGTRTAITPDPYNVTIGADQQNPTRLFNGTIDTIRVYNYSLSSGQILALYQNNSNVITDEETQVGDVWQCRVTPFSSSAAGSASSSNNITILTLPPPGVESISLNATSAYNLTTDNLTCNYALNGTAITAAVSWYKNGTPAMIVYLPMEGNSSNALLDYSGRGNNATSNGATWGSSVGYDGNGAFQFARGSSQYMSLPTGLLSSTKNFTISAWVYWADIGTTNWPRVFDFGTGTTVYMFLTTDSGTYPRFAITTGGTGGEQTITASSALSPYAWHHIVVTLNNATSTGTLYIDGAVAGTNASMALTPSSLGSTNQTWIGRSQYADPYFNGTIDDFRIYNYTLSAGQVLALYQNKTYVTVSQELTVGDVWQCRVTPFSSTLAGTTSNSNNVTILTLPPPGVESISLNATSTNNYTTDNLTCNYALNGTATTAAVSWYVNGAPQMALYLPMEGNSSNALVDYSGTGNTAANNGSAWNQTGGYNGTGGFRFNGTSNYINTTSTALKTLDNFTVSVWFKANETTQAHMVWWEGVSTENGWGTNGLITGQEMHFSVGKYNQSNTLSFFFGFSDLLAFDPIIMDVPFSDTSSWHQAVIVVTSANTSLANATMYVDGAFNASDTGNQTNRTGWNASFTLGKPGTNTREFNGTMDEVRIYPRALSAQEISALYQGRTNITVSQALTAGDVWQCRVTPFSSIAAGNTSSSNNLTINPQLVLVVQLNKTPADITVFNLLGSRLNITYNITAAAGLNASSPTLYHKMNNSVSDTTYFVNGTAVTGYITTDVSISNLSSTWQFLMDDNDAYPGTYNFNEDSMENTGHSNSSMASGANYVKVRLFNVSRTSNYSFFEVMAYNNSPTSSILRLYYCNSSYTTGSPAISASCTNFYNINNSVGYNHTHTAYSSHLLAPFSMNSSGYIGSVLVSPTSYFLLRGNTGGWTAAYITNVSRADTIQTSANFGATWSNLSGTVDAHLHQYNASDTFYWYACASDILGNSNCSSVGYDLLNLSGIPPTAPSVYSPGNDTLSGTVPINYTASSSPNGYPIANYSIALVYENGTFISTIQSNNSVNLSYSWNSTATANGAYMIRVQACDNLSQCSSGYSEVFTLAQQVLVVQANKTPADISTTNLLGVTLNITYNITTTAGLNASSVAFYYKTNTSASDTFIYINGSNITGYQTSDTTISNVSSIWQFLLEEHQVYPGTYNLDPELMDDTGHSNTSLANESSYVKIRLFNVSSTKNHSYFEFMAQNNSPTSSLLRIYYCNSSYASGNPLLSSNCIEFYTINNSAAYNHTHTAYSSHFIAPFAINTTSGQIYNVTVTPTSYFLLRGANSGGWNISYIANVSRADTIQASPDNGTTWSNFSGTVDAHFHQFSGSDTFYWYACASDIRGNSNCSTTGSDLLDPGGLPPTAPQVWSPGNSTYSGTVPINYTASISPNGYPIANYSIALVYPNGTFISTIRLNNSVNLSYSWNSTATANGAYMIRVQACDNLSQCSLGYSEVFTIANTNLTACAVITSGNSYVMKNNFVGAPNDASPFALSNFTCVKIAASNVVFDCAGFNMTDNGTSSTGTSYGILVNGSLTNVTVKNCQVSNYSYGVFINASNNSNFINNTAYANYNDGFKATATSGNNFTNNTARNNSISGFVLEPLFGTSFMTLGNLFNNNTAYGQPYGFYLAIASYCNFTSNHVYGNTYGFAVLLLTSNNFTNNSVHDGVRGFHILASSSGNTFANNSVYDTSEYGFYVESSTNNNFTNNSVHGDTDAFHVVAASSGNTFANNSAYASSQSGFYVESSTNNNFTGNTAYNNSITCFYFNSGSTGNGIINNTAHDAPYNLAIQAGSNGNAFINNTVYNSSSFDFQISDSSGNNFTNNTVYGALYGFHLGNVAGSLFANNTVHSNTEDGFLLVSSASNNFTGNLVYNTPLTDFWLQSNSTSNRFVNNTAHTSPFLFAIQGTCNNNLFANNTLYNSTGYGFQVSANSGNNFTNNTVYETPNGFHLNTVTGSTIANNTVYNNPTYGVYLISSTNNNIVNNTAYGNGNNFYPDTGSNDNLFANNTASGAWTGFWVISSTGNNLTGNTAYNNSYGIVLTASSNSVVANNTAYGSTYEGIYVFSSSNNNVVANNTVYNNTDYQFKLETSTGNLVYNNNFTAYIAQLVVFNDGANYWNRTRVCSPSIISGNCSGGNFYSDYAGYTYDGSGIGSTIYLIGNATDYLPLTNRTGTPPGLTSISLTATSPQNLSSDNLTCNYALNGTVTHVALSWSRNSTPFMALYLPFDGKNSSVDNTLLDYSGYGNNATVVSSPVWDPSGGPNGTSAYKFDGVDDYISVPNYTALNITGSVTLIAKVMRNDRLNDNYTQVLSKNGSYVMFISDNQSRVYCGNSTAWVRTREMPIIPNRYQTIACVINGSNISIYVNSGGTQSLPSVPIYTLGDSITAQHSMGWHAGDGTIDYGFDGGNVRTLLNTYQYWLDHYAGTYISSESVNKTPLVLGGYEPFHYNKGWSGLLCDDLLGPSARFPGSYDLYGSEVPNGSSVILMCGVNDIGTGSNASEVEADLQALYDRSVNKTDHLIMMTITPYNPNPTICQYIKDVNAWLRSFTTNNSIPFVDTWTPLVAADNCTFDPLYTDDTVHPNAVGAEILGRTISSTIFGNQSWNQTAVQQATENVSWTGLTTTNAAPLYIGALANGSYAPNASIAEIQVYPRALSSAQVGMIFSGSPVMVSQETNVGDTWQCTVTPLSAWLTGPTNSSNNLTIQANVSNCPVITAAGTYTQSANYTGAPNSASPLSGTACVVIAASNVTYDCAGFSIANNGTSGNTTGILLNSSATNATVKNCPGISGYNYSIYIYQSSNNAITNNTAYNSSNGFYLSSSNGNNLANNSAYNNTQDGVFLYSSLSNNLTGNRAYNNTYGFHFDSSSGNNLTNNSAYNNTNSGFFISAGSNNTLASNRAYNHPQHGFAFYSSSGNNLTNNSAYNNSIYGFYIQTSSSNNTLANNSAYNNTWYGFYIYFASNNNTMLNNVAFLNAYGAYIANSSLNNLTGNNLTNNTNTGLHLDAASSTTNLTSNRLCYNTFDLQNLGTQNNGTSDSCDSFAGWNENGHLGCEYACTSMWSRFFGDINGTIFLGHNDSAPYVYSWNGSAFSVYFADYDSNIHWTQLQAIGRNVSNGTSTNDFTELDTAFQTTAFGDNINTTYSTDNSTPRQTENYTVFGTPINYVPVANSTATNTTFRTGILWDTADGGTQYSNAYNQSTVWAVKAGQGTSDIYGTYDYLGQVPYTLGNYTGSNNVVAIYVELK